MRGLRVLLCALLALCSTTAQECGQRPAGSQIVGGVEAQANSWPWQGSLQFYNNETNAWGHTCGCSLYDDQWAITAAHCVHPEIDPRRGNPENFRILAGAHDIKNLAGNEQFINITKIVYHERFGLDPSIGYPNDIAILKLAEKPDTSRPNIGYACLPYPSNVDFNNQECVMTGWGLVDSGVIPDKLQQGKVPVLNNTECEGYFPYVRETHICVGRDKPSACSGDSGGPLNCYKDGKWQLAGLTSFGVIFCEGWPSVYTRVSSYWDWVLFNMENN